MKGLGNDTLWFISPDGGAVKLTLTGYGLVEADNLKQRMADAGWELLPYMKNPKALWSAPAWVSPFIWGSIISTFVAWHLFR